MVVDIAIAVYLAIGFLVATARFHGEGVDADSIVIMKKVVTAVFWPVVLLREHLW